MGNCIRFRPAYKLPQDFRNTKIMDRRLGWECKVPITASQLQDMRDVFWYTATNDPVEGRVYRILEVIVKCVQNNEVELAQTIFEQSGLFLPYGQLVSVLDARGKSYDIPFYVVCQPNNLIVDDESESDNSSGKQSTSETSQFEESNQSDKKSNQSDEKVEVATEKAKDLIAKDRTKDDKESAAIANSKATEETATEL